MGHEHGVFSSLQRISAAILILVLAWAGRAQAAVTLVENGQGRAAIVLSASPSAQAREAAEILQGYIERIGGAKLDIVTESSPQEGPRILVGQSESARRLGISIESRWTYDMNEEEYAIKTAGDALILAGNEHPSYRGTVYAVYEFLETLGCRWYFPGAYGEIIPKSATIVVEDMEVRSRPDFRFRNVWYSGWMPVEGNDAADFAVWADRNKMNSLKGVSLPGDGSVIRVIPPEKHFETMPQIFAINKKGERDKEMVCLTEPEAVKVAARTIIEEFRAHPEMATFGFAPPDGHPMCYCERCQAAAPNFRGKGYGDPSLSDVWFKFANAVAQEVYKEFPDRWILTNGYANRVRPPEGVGPLSPNLGIQSAMLDSCTFHSIGDPECWQRQTYQTVLDRWMRDLRCVFIYDYDPGKGLDGMPFPMLHNLERDIPYFKARGAWGFWTEGQNCWMVTHLNYYVRAKLMWNAQADVRALVHDYTRRFYGTAGKAIEDYIWTMEKAVDRAPVHETFGRITPWRVIYTPQVMRKLDRLVARAWSAHLVNPEATRLGVWSQVHRYIREYLAMEESAADGDFAIAAAQAASLMSIRTEVAQIDDSLMPVTPEWCAKGDSAPEWHQKVYQGLAERVDGNKGSLVAMTPRVWDFRKDPEDMGTLEQWYLPNAPGSWKPLDITQYWEAQGLQDEHGYGYTGKAWYRTNVQVPSLDAGKPVMLTIGGLYSDKLWIWVNGLLINHRNRQNTREPFDVEVTPYIKPGANNHVAILLETLPPDRNARGGLHRRVFLWSPVGRVMMRGDGSQAQ